jgi:hypothetical protein
MLWYILHGIIVLNDMLWYVFTIGILSPWIRWCHVIHITTYHILNTMAPYHTHPQSMNTVIPCNTYHILNTMPPYYTYPQSMYTVIPCNTYHNKSYIIFLLHFQLQNEISSCSPRHLAIHHGCPREGICYSGSKIYTFLFVDIYFLTPWSSQVHPEAQSKCVQATAGC